MRFWILSLAMVVASVAHAEVSPCVQSYRLAHDKYVNQIESLSRKRTETYVVDGVAAGGFGLCLKETKSVVGCGILAGLGAVGFLYGNEQSADLINLEDAYKIYDLYDDSRAQDLASPDIQGLFTQMGVPTNREMDVAAELKSLMESGRICKSGRPAASYEDVMTLLKERLYAAH